MLGDLYMSPWMSSQAAMFLSRSLGDMLGDLCISPWMSPQAALFLSRTKGNILGDLGMSPGTKKLGLHNFLRKECRSNEFLVELDDEASSLLVNEDDDFEPFFETQEQQRENANGLRDAIAADMWRDVEHLVN
ncbi:hypothetical protein Dsin_001905 [Dipteronia sinensis]|uniref:Uncharacterized protein n=1 Tax=Dipteronia sinensis TaxID=43782 RepID=A0AAE0B694_9ROSI|nr:hypothetical protein Dsin_001905 [Dipteronia sinensis]